MAEEIDGNLKMVSDIFALVNNSWVEALNILGLDQREDIMYYMEQATKKVKHELIIGA